MKIQDRMILAHLRITLIPYIGCHTHRTWPTVSVAYFKMQSIWQISNRLNGSGITYSIGHTLVHDNANETSSISIYYLFNVNGGQTIYIYFLLTLLFLDIENNVQGYQWGHQKPQIEEGQTTQWLKGQTMMYFTEN